MQHVIKILDTPFIHGFFDYVQIVQFVISKWTRLMLLHY